MQSTKVLRSISPSSRAWLARQNSDPYVKKRYTSATVYRSRSAYKLIEIDDKYKILSNPNVRAVVDLGAAPGGWSQVVAQRLGWDESAKEPPTKLKGIGYGKNRDIVIRKHGTWSTPKLVGLKENHKYKGKGKEAADAHAETKVFDPLNIDEVDVHPNLPVGIGKIVAVDLLPMQPIHGVFDFRGDFLRHETQERLRQLLATDPENPHGKVDVVLSDISPNLTGQKMRDTQQSLDVCESVLNFAMGHLRAPQGDNDLNGVVLVKFFYHQLLQEFCQAKLSPRFHDVRIVKPQASRKGSEEAYFLCRGWRGLDMIS